MEILRGSANSIMTSRSDNLVVVRPASAKFTMYMYCPYTNLVHVISTSLMFGLTGLFLRPLQLSYSVLVSKKSDGPAKV